MTVRTTKICSNHQITQNLMLNRDHSLLSLLYVLVHDSVQLHRVVHILIRHLTQRLVHCRVPVLAFGLPFDLHFHGRASLIRQKYGALAAAQQRRSIVGQTTAEKGDPSPEAAQLVQQFPAKQQ